jgi:hypothetical protein
VAPQSAPLIVLGGSEAGDRPDASSLGIAEELVIAGGRADSAGGKRPPNCRSCRRSRTFSRTLAGARQRRSSSNAGLMSAVTPVVVGLSGPR